MTAEQFATLAREVYGSFGWAAAIAEKCEVHRSTAIRWGTGDIPIPDSAIATLRRDAAEKLSAVGRLLA